MSRDLDPEDWRPGLVERYGVTEADFIVADIRLLEVSSTEREFEYVDNTRVMRIGDAEETLSYEVRRKRGCCGEYNTETGVSPEGHRYRWGFNYGH